MNIFWMSIKYHVYYLLDNQSKVERCRKTQQTWPYFVFIRQSSMLVILKYVLYMAQSLLGFQIYYVWVQKQILSLSDKQISNGKILHTCMYKSLKKKRKKWKYNTVYLDSSCTCNLCFMETFDFMENVLNGTISIKIIWYKGILMTKHNHKHTKKI